MDGRVTLKAGQEYEVVSWGNGTWGQLGHGTQSNDRTPRVMGALHRKHVVFVAAGFHHSVALTGIQTNLSSKHHNAISKHDH